MDATFQHLLRKFVIIFFDGILVYSKIEEEHLGHLNEVLRTLRSHQFLVKYSKCSFGKNSLNFLGHIISSKGVEPDLTKLSAMVDWPICKNIKQLREISRPNRVL